MIILYSILLAGALLIIYMVTVAHAHNIVEHEAFAYGENDTIRLVFISDVHNRRISTKGFPAIGNVDAVIIGGDFCDKRTSKEKLCTNLEQLQTLGPIYFVWGNNDREFGEQKLRQIFDEYNVTVVENDAVKLPDRVNTTWITAIDDTSTRNYSFKRALAKCEDNDVTICVTHNPQVFHIARRQKRLSLLMGGHLHGGQIRLGKFGLHPNGSFSIRHGIPTLISNGYGTTLVPLRLGAKPQMHVITLQVNKMRKNEIQG